MQANPSRHLVLCDSRYPGGRGLLVAWDCNPERLDGFSEFLFRSGSEFVIQRSHPGIPHCDQVAILNADEARDTYRGLRTKLLREPDAFAPCPRRS
jgi:hypothetical protein